MANTYTQLYIQCVFAVSGRNNLISENWEKRLYKYITGILQTQGQKMLAINGMPDHIHFFFGLAPTCSISDLVREIKKSSNEFVNDNHFTKLKFSWQSGFGAFSYSRSQIDNVVNYILNQKDHHRRKTFQEEYKEFLKKFQVDYDEKYLFEYYD